MDAPSVYQVTCPSPQHLDLARHSQQVPSGFANACARKQRAESTAGKQWRATYAPKGHGDQGQRARTCSRNQPGAQVQDVAPSTARTFPLHPAGGFLALWEPAQKMAFPWIHSRAPPLHTLGSALPRAGDVFESKLEPNAPTPQLLLKPSHQCPDLENHSSLLLSPTPSSVSLRRDPASPASASSQLLSPPRANPRSGSGHALLCRRHPRPGTGQMLSQPVSSSTAL